MSFDKTLLDAIEERAIALSTVTPDTDFPAVLLPKGISLQSIESFNERPYLHGGLFGTRRLDSFIKYVIDHTEARTHVFIDAEEMVARAAFDHFDPTEYLTGWRKHNANLQLKTTPEWDALTTLSRNAGKHFSQRDFMEFIQDWGYAIEFHSNEDAPIDNDAVYQAVQSLKITDTVESVRTEGDLNRTLGSLEELDIQGKTASLPAKMIMTCNTHIGLPEIKVCCQFMVIAAHERGSADHISLGYRINQLDHILDQSALDFEDKIREGISDETPIWMGEFNRRNLEY